jgi:AcrR family transcriptional regulator
MNRRELQAAETRRLILVSARRRFAEDGYARTSLKTIAADVGVSVQTIYDSVGAKADLVRRLNDLIDEEAQVGELAATIATETDPMVVVAVSAKVTRRIFERCGDLVRAGFEGARAEPELSEVAVEGGRRHRAGARRVAARLAQLKALKKGLSVDEAATTLAALSDIRVAFLLADDHGLSPQQVEDWITLRSVEALLRG